MTTELNLLTLTILMTALFWVPYVLNRLAVRGLFGLLAGTSPDQGTPQSDWAQRAIKAHTNAVENLALYAPLVLTAHVLNLSNPATKFAAVLYLVSRAIHFVVYTGGVPAVRTLAFTGGWIAQVIFVATILKWI